MGLQKPKGKPNRPEWVAIYITHNLQEAHVIAGKLNAFDIPSMVNTVPGASAFGITYGNMGEIKILIHPDDYNRAEEVLFPEEDENDVQYQLDEDGDGEYYIEEDEDSDE